MQSAVMAEGEMPSVFGTSAPSNSTDLPPPLISEPSSTDPSLEPTQDEMERERLMAKAEQLQDEILELRKELNEKELELSEVKKSLGITPLTEFKQSMAHGWDVLGTKIKGVQETGTYRKIDTTLTTWKSRMEESNAYQKTVTTLSDGSSKAKDAFTSAGTKIKESEKVKALGERTSSTIKWTGTKLSSAASTLKEKVWTSTDHGDGETPPHSEINHSTQPPQEEVVPDEPAKKD